MKDKTVHTNVDPALHAIRSVLRSALPKAHKAVLVGLITRAKWYEEQEAWMCWPSYATIADDASISRAGVAKVLRELRGGTHLLTSARYPETHASAVYSLNMDALRALPQRKKGEETFTVPKGWKPPPKATP